MIDTDLLQFVLALNTDAADRVYLDSPDQDAPLPLVVLRRSGGAQPRTTGGQKLAQRSDFEVNVLGTTHSQSYPITAAIKAALDGFKGTMGTTHVLAARCTSAPDHITEIDGDNRRRWVTSTFRFMHSEG